MSVKILGGIARGFTVKIPKGNLVRPTSVLLKRKLFDSWQNLDDFVFIDICAGSGAIGFEAISRGAENTIFIDSEYSSIKTLKNNVSLFEEKFGQVSYQIIRSDFRQWIEKFKNEYCNWLLDQRENTILFFDPPYENKEFYQKFIDTILDDSWFQGHVWIESDCQKGVAENFFRKFDSIHTKTYKQGSRFISLFAMI